MQIRNLSYILFISFLTFNLGCVSKKKSPANPVDTSQKVPEDTKLDEKSLQTHSTNIACRAHCNQIPEERCDELCCTNKGNEIALCAEKDSSFNPPSPGSSQACEALCIQKPEEFNSLISAITNEDIEKDTDGDGGGTPKTVFNCSIHKAGEYEDRALGPGDWIKLHGDAVDEDNNAIAHAELLIESSDDAAQLVTGSWRAAVLEPGKFRYTGFNAARITVHRTCIQHKCKVGSTSCERA